MYCEDCYLRASDVYYGKEGFRPHVGDDMLYIVKLTKTEYDRVKAKGCFQGELYDIPSH